MKYLIIPYIAFGLILALAIGIEYNCEGPEMFPMYYGSPFVFKQDSLASSMQYFYSITGILLNVLVWSGLLFLIHRFIRFTIKKLGAPKWARISYAASIGLLITFATLRIAIESVVIGKGFDKERNYWYWDMSKEAREWGVNCKGHVVTFVF